MEEERKKKNPDTKQTKIHLVKKDQFGSELNWNIHNGEFKC